MNPELLVCGLAAPFREPTVDAAWTFTRAHFETFVAAPVSVPLCLDHGTAAAAVMVPGPAGRFAMVNQRFPRIGQVHRFAFANAASVPAGLAALAELDEAFADLRVDMTARNSWDEPALGGLSLGIEIDMAGGAVATATPTELSVTAHPRFDRARIAGVGREALDVWELLTGEPADAVTNGGVTDA